MDLGPFGYPRGMSHRIGELGGAGHKRRCIPDALAAVVSVPAQGRHSAKDCRRSTPACASALSLFLTSAEQRRRLAPPQFPKWAALPKRSGRVMTRGGHLALGTVALVALVAATAATATPPGRNGLIVYGQELRPDHSQLFTIRPDGSDATQITHVVNAGNPDWSPNGKTIVAELDAKGGAGITLLSPSGTRHPQPDAEGVSGTDPPFRRTASGSCTSATSPPATTGSG